MHNRGPSTPLKQTARGQKRREFALENDGKQPGIWLMATQWDGRAIVATPKETMTALRIGRAKFYELLNSGILESFLEGKSRKVLWRSIEAYVERRLGEEAHRRGNPKV
ncbi:helix-turn-helix domain-containing protein [Bradyrhizobium betae]|uniref:helix-turn-helix domain-containing protein n=1 Tax=Bradyrhizobium betae TaxID=244734 RepID=UPI001FCEEB4D|nr:helix-turn-helix domain-containing protein [Bradyrhizobium betae]MCS3726188.1 hypothetical protein [Bradyrhizobium betae]